MCLRLSTVGLAALVAVSCAQAVPESGDSSRSESAAPKGDGWRFESARDGVSLDFPSRDWKEKPKATHLADFYAFYRGSPMLVALVSVKRQGPEVFRQAAKALKREWERNPDLLAKPTYEQGETKDGNLYAWVHGEEKGQQGDTYYYVALSRTWLKGKGVTVEVLFEGQGKMLSRTFRAAEHAHFERAAKAICLSVK